MGIEKKESHLTMIDLEEEIWVPAKIRFIEMLPVTFVLGKAKRIEGERGERRIAEEQRIMPILAFPEKDGEFALTLHDTNPEEEPAPYYLNFRNLPEEVVKLIALSMVETVETNFFEDVSYLVGVPDSAIVIAKELSRITGIPCLEVLEKNKNKDIFPQNPSDKWYGNVCLVEDIFTKAINSIKTAKAIRSLGFNVIKALAAIDREEGGIYNLKQEGIDGRVVTVISEIFNQLREEELIKPHYSNCISYNERHGLSV
ncbi:MAG: hypothetical protein A2152_01705 [Candidatus Levybacteria bacterium RBG_16_35_6]|nr:MAG: hypothetical protein A2152_01705 [Candidatus Levybacteria bacterium RBG_16_35_6]